MNHYFVIRSAYAPTYPIEQNEYRLALTERYCVPSLVAQTRQDFIVELRVNPFDPLLDSRLKAFSNSGLVVTTSHATGRHIRTRLDDDDAIAVDFVERLRSGIVGEGWYTFPNGYVTGNSSAWPRQCPSNQFLTRVGESGVFEIQHRNVKNPIVIDEQPAWLWVRHRHNRSPLPIQNNGVKKKAGVPLSDIAEIFPCVSA